MTKKEWIIVGIGLALALALFFAGRFTAPRPPAERILIHKAYDSILREQLKTQHLFEQAEIREQYHKDLADKNFREGILYQQQQTRASRKTYEQDTASNHRRTAMQRDSILFSRYKRPRP